MQASLYLIPVPLGETELDHILPPHNHKIIGGIRHFIVENIRTARRFLKKSNPDIVIDELTFYTLNKYTSPEEVSDYLKPIEAGESIGIISEAGCPAIADPGADVVAIAQRKGYKVVPMIGPSSILLSLMASGFNGQSFSFWGYLPIDTAEKIKKLKLLEQHIYNENQTQIFIETPYRNHKIIEEIIKYCRPQTRLCIAANITCPDEYIRTRTVQEWSKEMLDLHKKPCIFLLYK